MENPLISFIIPYYNVPIPLLEECVGSIEEINVSREIIIVNDGCDADLTAFEGRCKVHRIEHVGLAGARNYAIDVAEGEYIQFVDADDKLIVGTYQWIVDTMKSAKPDMFYFAFTAVDSNHSCTKAYTTSTGTEHLLNHNIRGSACGYVFRRSILGELRFTDGIFHEDEEFTPQLMLLAKTFFYTESSAYYYRKSPHSIMTSRNEEHISKRLNDFLLVILNLEETSKTLRDVDAKSALRRRRDQLCMDYLYNIIRLGRRRELKERIQDLKENYLYPLPLKRYTWKYYVAAILTRL